MFYPICTSLDRIQSLTLDLNWNGSKRVHFGERSQTGTDSGSVPVRIQQVQCRRKTYLYPYWYGSVWIRSSVNGVLFFTVRAARPTLGDVTWLTRSHRKVFLRSMQEYFCFSLFGSIRNSENITRKSRQYMLMTRKG